jgi:hypothetical protein
MNTINQTRTLRSQAKRKLFMTTHRPSLLPLNLIVALVGVFSASAAPVGTTFSYQGQLKNNGVPVNGPYDIRVTLYSTPTGSGAVGSPNPNVFGCWPVNNGLFTVQLNFGGLSAYDCQARWLEFATRPCNNTNSFQVLTQRVELLPTPYALQSLSACSVESNGVTTVSIQDGSVTANKIGSGQVVKSLNGLRDAVNLVAGNNVTITPNGNNLQIAATGGGSSSIWSLNGANAFYNAGNVGIGTLNPSRRLEVQGPGDLEIGLKSTDPRGALWTLQSTAASSSFPNPIMPWEGSFQIIDRTAGASRLSILANGRVGLGTIEPSHNLEVAGLGDVEIGLKSKDVGGRLWTIQSSGTAGNPSDGTFQIIDRSAGASRLRIDSGGAVSWGQSSLSPDQNGAIELGDSTAGAGAPYIDFHRAVGHPEDFNVRLMNDADKQLSLYGNLNIADGDIRMNAGRSISSSGRLHIQANEDLYLNPFGGAGTVIVGGGGGPGNFHVVGSASVCSLTIRGGCDLAEPFQMSESEIPKGSLVIIDEENEGRLKLAAKTYDTRVAGIISGANGVNPGISLHQEGLIEGGQNVALSGRVYALADSSNGSIKPGDLLTSSSTPGHVMKVTDHARSQGAIVGKSMSALKEGKGMVLVLVTLQ